MLCFVCVGFCATILSLALILISIQRFACSAGRIFSEVQGLKVWTSFALGSGLSLCLSLSISISTGGRERGGRKISSRACGWVRGWAGVLAFNVVLVLCHLVRRSALWPRGSALLSSANLDHPGGCLVCLYPPLPVQHHRHMVFTATVRVNRSPSTVELRLLPWWCSGEALTSFVCSYSRSRELRYLYLFVGPCARSWGQVRWSAPRVGGVRAFLLLLQLHFFLVSGAVLGFEVLKALSFKCVSLFGA